MWYLFHLCNCSCLIWMVPLTQRNKLSTIALIFFMLWHLFGVRHLEKKKKKASKSKLEKGLWGQKATNEWDQVGEIYWSSRNIHIVRACSCALTATWNKFVTRKGVPQSTNPIKWWVPIGLLHDWCFCLFIVHTTIWWLVMLFKHIISILTVVVP